MGIEEAKKYLMDKAYKDVDSIRKMLDDFRRDSGIPFSQLIACLEFITSEYKILREVLGK